MQRQKKIAKWLAIVLLFTMAVGAYIMYDALYVNGDNGTAAGTDGVRQPDDQTPPPDGTPDAEPDPPYYTELPRAIQSFGATEVFNAGGEGDDTLAAAVFAGTTTLLFFNTDSEEYDCRGKGAYCAVFTSEQLLSVKRLSADETVTDAKLTTEGVTVLSRTATGGKLRLLGTDGSEKAVSDFPLYSDAEIHVGANNSTHVYYIGDGNLRHAKIGAGLQPVVSSFVCSANVSEIGHVVTSVQSDLIVANTSTGGVLVLSFSQEGGFTITESIEKASFLQLAAVAGETAPAFCILLSLADKLMLSVLDERGVETVSRVVENRSRGALFSDGVSLTLVCNGITEIYCRHLDVIASSSTSVRFDEVLFAKTSAGRKLLGYVSGETFGILSVQSDNSTDSLFRCDREIPALICSAADSENLHIAFSCSLTQGLFYQNFGKKDVFLFSVAF